MELKEIFSQTDKGLHQSTDLLRRRHSEFKQIFDGFANRTSRQPNENKLMAEGWVVELHQDDNFFLVGFCGKQFHFSFAMVRNGDQCVITCRVRSVELPQNADKIEWIELGRFTFDRFGVTNLTPPGYSEPFNLSADWAPTAVITPFLVAAFR